MRYENWLYLCGGAGGLLKYDSKNIIYVNVNVTPMFSEAIFYTAYKVTRISCDFRTQL